MATKLCSDLIYNVSKYLNTKDKISYLQTEREANRNRDLPVFKNYIRAVKIQRWWRKQMIPCINGDKLSYKISLNSLIKNWPRFTDRKIQFISYMVGSRDKTMPIIYTVTCDKTLTKNCLNVRFPGSVNIYSFALNSMCKYQNINRVGEVVEFETENIISETLHVLVR